ncbi:hypothetical protein ACT3UM_23375 [Halomonas sp. AOP13-D3-9]
MAKKLTPFVIAYDFDGILAPGNMQEHNFMPALRVKPSEFWQDAKRIAKEQDADEILSYIRVVSTYTTTRSLINLSNLITAQSPSKTCYL